MIENFIRHLFRVVPDTSTSAKPLALVVVNRGKRLGLHHIGVKLPMEMIDLVLQDPRIPTGRFDDSLLPVLVEAGHSNRGRSRYHGHQSRDAETAFIEGNIGSCEQIYLRIDNRVGVDGPSLPLT
jgi:hypothetical protein